MYASPYHSERDREIKCDRLRRYLDRHALDELWLATDGNVGWLLGGDTLVVRSDPVGVAAVRFDGESIVVWTDTIEADRLRAEELPAGLTVEAVDWDEGSLETLIERRAGEAAGADVSIAGLATIDPVDFRLPATGADVERLRALGRETAAGLEATCRAIDPGDTEREVAADLGYRLARRGIDAPVRLVGGEARAPSYRHFTPTNRAVGGYAVVSVSSRRAGLWISATRTVTFDPPEWLADRHHAATRVDATAIAATRHHLESGTAGDVFAAVEDAYDAVGFTGEWRHHHQGGATGYASREWIATPDDPTTIEGPLAVAWNPTVQGTKSEDSVLVTGDGFDVLTASGEWPTRSVEPIGGGEPVDRPAVLGLS